MQRRFLTLPKRIYMAAKKANTDQGTMEMHYHKQMKIVFGLLVLLVGIYGIAGDMGLLGAKTPVSPWWLLVSLFGLGMLVKATYKCPPSKPK